MTIPKQLAGKNIVISGASSGIGRSCAIECSKSGANVHLIARNLKSLEETRSELDKGNHSIQQLDVTESDSIEPIIKSIVEQHGGIDGFIHSAGIQRVQPFRTMDKSHYLDMFSINTIAAFELSRSIVKKQHCSANSLSLVFIASVMSVVAGAGLTSYCASKAALVGGARAMAIELAPRKIRVNCVSPGTVTDTQMTKGLKSMISEDEFLGICEKYPSGLGSPINVADLCVFLLSDKSKWITGQNIIIDGGYSAI